MAKPQPNTTRKAMLNFASNFMSSSPPDRLLLEDLVPGQLDAVAGRDFVAFHQFEVAAGVDRDPLEPRIDDPDVRYAFRGVLFQFLPRVAHPVVLGEDLDCDVRGDDQVPGPWRRKQDADVGQTIASFLRLRSKFRNR